VSEIWAVLQAYEGMPSDYNQEVLAEAEEAARRQPGAVRLCAVQLGAPGAAAFSFEGVVPQRLYLLEHERLATYSTASYVSALAWLLRRQPALLMVTSATAIGQDWAPRLAARLSLPFAPRCLGFALEDDALLALRVLYGGRAYAQTRTALHGRTALITFVPGARGAPPASSAATPGAAPETIRLRPELPDPAADARIRHLGIEAPSAEEVALEEADKIVAGGRGVGKEGFAEIMAFARLLGAAVGASRVATDRGWVEPERQIGATGKSVRPRLYIACGISGAVQHTSGIREAETIVAINPDRTAPIFALADLGLLGDAREILRRAAGLLREPAAST
jgi:electron transfer flavoprotein alpha subunit